MSEADDIAKITDVVKLKAENMKLTQMAVLGGKMIENFLDDMADAGGDITRQAQVAMHYKSSMKGIPEKILGIALKDK